MEKIDFIDAGFLRLETREAPMHVAALSLLEFPKGAHRKRFLARAAEIYRSSTELRRPLGYRVAHGILGSFGPMHWEPDPDLDLDYHISHWALPQPGRYRELFDLVGRLHSNMLDRSRPLWEVHVIEGLKNRQFAVYTKMHHATIDGIAGIKMTEDGCSPDPNAVTDYSPMSMEAYRKSRRKRRKPAEHDSPPSEFELKAVAEFVKAQFNTSAHALGLVKNYATTWLGLGNGLAVPWRHVPHTVINSQVSSARRVVAQSWSIDRIRAVSSATGTTINDIVLAMCSGALRKYLVEQDDLPQHSLRAMVPVSVRDEDAAQPAVAISYITANLGTKYDDPGDRLETIVESMQAGKKMLADLSPRESMFYASLTQLPLFLANMAGVADWFPAFSTVISNVPGPKEQLYWNGAPLIGAFPFSAVFHGFALNITFIGYNGKLDFGLVACRRSVPHMQRLVGYLEDSLTELEAMI